jgi:hypothetical protein
VHLQGGVKQISASAANGANPWLIGTLPPQASPTRWVYTVVPTSEGTYADLAINPQGQIFVIDPKPPAIKDYTFVSLEGITYQR